VISYLEINFVMKETPWPENVLLVAEAIGRENRRNQKVRKRNAQKHCLRGHKVRQKGKEM
jgi:hypothetical protein